MSITELLSLPCVLNTLLHDEEQVILSGAKQFGTSEFLQVVMTGESLSDFLRRIYRGASSYMMDCSIYAQLASLVLDEAWPTTGGFIFLYTNPEVNETFMKLKSNNLGYIAIQNKELRRKLPIPDQRRWAVRINDNQLIGLSEDGPRVMTMAKWVNKLRTKLISPPDSSYLSFKDFDPERLFFNTTPTKTVTNDFNNWGFYINPDFAVLVASYKDGDITVEENPIPLLDGEFVQILYPSPMKVICLEPNPTSGVSGVNTAINIDGVEHVGYDHFKKKMPKYDEVKIIADEDDPDSMHCKRLVENFLDRSKEKLPLYNPVIECPYLPIKPRKEPKEFKLNLRLTSEDERIMLTLFNSISEHVLKYRENFTNGDMYRVAQRGTISSLPIRSFTGQKYAPRITQINTIGRIPEDPVCDSRPFNSEFRRQLEHRTYRTIPHHLPLPFPVDFDGDGLSSPTPRIQMRPFQIKSSHDQFFSAEKQRKHNKTNTLHNQRRNKSMNKFNSGR